MFMLQAAARMIKEGMDKKFGPSWHAVVGEGYGFEISYECKSLLYMFFGGNVAICIWKCSQCLFDLTLGPPFQYYYTFCYNVFYYCTYIMLVNQ